jgi:Family of unknown function (DUF5662)
MTEAKFKTMRHIETVRNYLNFIIRELLNRQERHDQSKLEFLEVETFEKFTPLLRGVTYGSPEYHGYLREMDVAIQNHYQNNRHHPEYFEQGIQGMNLIDVLEMLVDWRAASMRHDDGDIYRSIEINQTRFGYSDELKQILKNTADLLVSSDIYHKADES